MIIKYMIFLLQRLSDPSLSKSVFLLGCTLPVTMDKLWVLWKKMRVRRIDTWIGRGTHEESKR